MKFLDEKGRLFGKINVIDLFVILVFLAGVAFGGYRLLGGGIASASNVKEIEFVVRCHQRFQFNADALNTGDVVMSLSRPEDAYISDFYYELSRMSATNSEGHIVDTVHPFLVDIYVTIKTKMDINQNIYSLGSQEIVVGRQFTVKTKETEMWGNVMSITILD